MPNFPLYYALNSVKNKAMQTFSPLFIFIGGGLGACTRAALQTLSDKWLHLQSHWAILAVNLLGCLLIGMVAEPLLKLENAAWRLLIITGFLGGFTTYSSFILDFLKLAHSAPLAAAYHLAAHLLGGIAACLLGMKISAAML